MSPVSRLYRSGKQGVVVGVDLLPIIPIDPLREFVIHIPTNVGSAGLEIMVF